MVNRHQSAGSASGSATGFLSAPERAGRCGFDFRTAPFPGAIVERDPTRSFVCTVFGPGGHFVERRHFDVPDEEYELGLITGARAAAEQFQALAHGDTDQALASMVASLRAAGSIPVTDGRYGAAEGYLRGLASIALAVARQNPVEARP